MFGGFAEASLADASKEGARAMPARPFNPLVGSLRTYVFGGFAEISLPKGCQAFFDQRWSRTCVSG